MANVGLVGKECHFLILCKL